MNIKNLFEKCKRNIALIILICLIVGLFGSFSFLMAMETAVITDFNGQTVQLDNAQRTALGCCETLKHMIQDMPGHVQEVPFEGILPYITNQNFQRLSHLIEDKAYIDQLMQNQDCIELFKFADYMKAPQETRSVLADRIYEPLRAKIKDTANAQEKAELEYFCETVESNLSYYPDFSSLRKDVRDIKKIGNINRSPIDFSLGSSWLDKKLRALEGIEELSGQVWAQRIKNLSIKGHDIQKLDFAQIPTAFPAVLNVDLKDNNLRHITGINANNMTIDNVRNIKIDLRNNPIESITINNPRLLKTARIFIDKDKRPVVTFNQSRFDKCAAWLEALRAQGQVALNRPGMVEELIGATVGTSIASIFVNSGFWLYDLYKEGKSFNSLDVRSFAKSQLLTTAAFTAPHVLYACISKMLNERNQIRQELAQLAYDDGDHVNVCWTEPYHHGDTRMVVTHSCPSKYAYNLFGKN